MANAIASSVIADDLVHVDLSDADTALALPQALNISAVVEGYQWTPPALLGLLLVMLGNVLVFRRPKPRAGLLRVNEGG